jgi:hypothetical protein
MNFLRLFPLFCLSAPLFAQTTSPAPTADHSLTVQRVVRSPQIRNAQAFGVLPQIADGSVWSTQIVLVNLNPLSGEPYELDFYDVNGNPTTVPIIGQGSVSTLSGTLTPGQTIRFTTPGTAATETDSWGTIINSNTGNEITAYEVIRDTLPAVGYFAETAISCDYGVYNTAVNPGGFMPFDNTNGGYTAIAMVNPAINGAPGGTDSLLVEIYDSTGALIGTHTVTLTPGQHTAFLGNALWPETDNLQGTLYFTPTTGTFSPITMFELRSFVSGTYKTISTVNLLQVTCPANGCP